MLGDDGSTQRAVGNPDDSTLGVPKALLGFQVSVTRPKIGLVSKKVNVDAKEGVTFEI